MPDPKTLQPSVSALSRFDVISAPVPEEKSSEPEPASEPEASAEPESLPGDEF